MSEMNRRDFGLALAAVAALARESQAQQPATLAEPRVFRYDQLPVKTNAVGGESRAVLSGTLPTGEFIEAHETVVQPGQMPHPPHQHAHSELILIREGKLEYYLDGKTQPPAGPGDIFFSASNIPHGMKNVGTVPAKYFVVAIGVQKATA